MNEILFIIQSQGVKRFHADLSNHGGELGFFLLLLKPVDFIGWLSD
jgi:hypothetical protein